MSILVDKKLARFLLNYRHEQRKILPKSGSSCATILRPHSSQTLIIKIGTWNLKRKRCIGDLYVFSSSESDTLLRMIVKHISSFFNSGDLSGDAAGSDFRARKRREKADQDLCYMQRHCPIRSLYDHQNKDPAITASSSNMRDNT